MRGTLVHAGEIGGCCIAGTHHNRRMAEVYFIQHQPDSVRFQAAAYVAGFCEAPDTIVAAPAGYLPEDGSRAGSWDALNVTCGTRASLSNEDFIKIGGALAEATGGHW